MAKLGDLVVNIGANTKDLNKKLGKVRREMRSMSSNFKAVGQSMSRSLTLPLLAIGAAAIKSSADLETLETSFISLTGGAEQAADMMKQLNDFTAKTPFQIDAVATSARQLIASGTGIAEVNEQLQFLGDIAATTGQPINEIAAIFAKVNAKGKVELENLNQLAERGIPVFKGLADATGLLPSELGAGAVTVQQFNDYLKSLAEEGGLAHGAMERLSETAAGKFSTAMDNLKLAGAELVESLMPALKQGIDKVTELAQRFTGLSDSTKKTILVVGAIVAALGPLLIMIPNIIAGITGLRTAFIFLNATMLANPIVAIAVGAAALTLALASLVDTTSDAKKNTDEFIESLDGLEQKQKEVGITTRLELLKTEKVHLEIAARAEAAAASVGALGDKFDKQIASGNTQRYTEQAANLGEEIALLNEELQNLLNPADKIGDSFEDSASSTKGATSAVLEYVDAISLLGPALIKVEGINKQLQKTTWSVGDTIDEVNTKLEDFASSVEDAMSAAAAAMLAGTIQMLATASSMEKPMEAIATSLLSTFADMAMSLGKLAIGYGITIEAIKEALKALSGAGAIIAGIALVALGAGLKGAIAKRAENAGMPELHSGGLAFGPTTAIVGDNKNAAIDPEVIAPLSKLRDMMGGASTNVYGRISGDDIVISNDRAMRDRNRYV